MTIDLAPDIEERINQQMASGRYASTDDLFRKALDSLQEQERFIADIEESLEDERRGDVMPVREFDKQMREEHSFLRRE